MIYSTIGALTSMSLISLGQQVTHYLAENPQNCATGGETLDENCFFVKGNSEVLLGGYLLKSVDRSSKLSNDLEFACGVGPPDATGQLTVWVEGLGSAAFRRTLAIAGLDIITYVSLRPMKMSGGYETTSGKHIDFDVMANVTVKQYGKADISFAFPSRGVCSVGYDGDNVSVDSSIQVDGQVSTSQDPNHVSFTRILLLLESHSEDRFKWNMAARLEVEHFNTPTSLNASFPLYNTTVPA